MNLSQSALRIFFAKSAGAVLFFLGITFFARELGPSQIGIFFLFQTVLGLTTIAADIGIRGGLEKRLSQGLDPSETLGSAILIKLIAIVLMSGGILAVRDPLNQYLGGDFAGYLALALVLREAADVFIQTLRGELRVGETAVIEFSRHFVWVVVSAVLILADFGVIGLVYGLIIGEVVALCWSVVKVETSVGRPSRDYAVSLFSYAKYYFVSSLGGKVYQWMDVAIIGLFLTYADVGMYEIAWQVTLLVLLASNAISTTLFPQLSQWDAENATDRIERVVSQAVGVTLFVSIPALLGAVVLGNDILQLVFGPEYAAASLVLFVLMVEKVFQSVNDVLGGALQALNYPNLSARAMSVAIALNIVLNVVLVLSIGLIGAAIATTTAAIVHTLLQGYYLSTIISFRVPYRLLSLCVLTSVLMAGALLISQAIVPVYSVPLLLSQLLFGIFVYVLLAVAFPTLREQIIVPGIKVLT
ncbi:oligosaccharide flippase family protein [Natronorubrum sp. FCH18a]|uniref:oligosaccharide flippase family protein n=1 Tax=Natronorubrum sp. FCH18a TaxID=3447018 RepID=UPI003F510D6F